MKDFGRKLKRALKFKGMRNNAEDEYYQALRYGNLMYVIFNVANFKAPLLLLEQLV